MFFTGQLPFGSVVKVSEEEITCPLHSVQAVLLYSCVWIWNCPSIGGFQVLVILQECEA